MRPILLVPLLGCLALACPKANRQTVFVAATNETIRTATEEAQGDAPAHNVWVTNASTETIIVTSVTLRGCENIKQQCAPRKMRLTVGPGRRVMLIRVEPRDRHLGFSYNFTFAWQPSSAPAIDENS